MHRVTASSGLGSPARVSLAAAFGALLAAALLALGTAVPRAAFGAEQGDLNVFGDFRARYEQDVRSKVDSGTGDLIEDEERSRIRYRFRIGMRYQANEHVQVGARLSSGDSRDANSPHVVLGSQDNRDNQTPNDEREGNFGFTRDPITLDRAYVRGTYGDGYAWFGRNAMPLWQPNEYFWDSDVSPEGVAGGWTFSGLGPVDLIVQAGNFVIQEGGWEKSNSAPNVHMETYQGVAAAAFDPVAVTVAHGAVTTDGQAQVRSQNAALTQFATYRVSNVQARLALDGPSVLVGFDWYQSDLDEDETGTVIGLGLKWGDLSVAAYLVDIEANAVTAFAQDDWPNYYSDFEGYQLKFAYALLDGMSIDLNRFDGERLSNSDETETRSQINFNVKF